MAQVIGLGGLFFKCRDPEATRQWYARVLGIAFHEWGGAVFSPAAAASHPGAGTVFSPFAADTDYFAPGNSEFMINLMVDDLGAMLAKCAGEGVQPVAPPLDEANGRFAQIIDCDGRKVELWQPKPMD